jgi:hypothetical protein
VRFRQIPPPQSTRLWPKTVGDISDSFLKQMLEQADSAACGGMSRGSTWLIAIVLVDGIVCTNDLVFWLSKICYESKSEVVYRILTAVGH